MVMQSRGGGQSSASWRLVHDEGSSKRVAWLLQLVRGALFDAFNKLSRWLTAHALVVSRPRSSLLGGANGLLIVLFGILRR